MSSELSDEEVARYWNSNADAWAAEVRKGNDLAREFINNPAFLEFIGDLVGKEVLDAGCGEGYNTRILAGRGARMTGIDVTPRMIELARAEERREPRGIRYEQASLSDLGILGDVSFDAAVSFMALMDGPSLERAFSEIFRVLRPGGMLAFSITHPCFVTRGGRWLRDEQGNKLGLVVSNYFNSESWVDRWRFADAPTEAPQYAVPRFDRTLPKYVNGIIDAGFVLQRVFEPRLPEDYCRVHPSQRGWRDHAASYLYFKAIEPA